MPKIVVIEGRMKGQTFDFEGESLFLGRSIQNDIQLEDPAVSRKHIKFTRVGEKYFIEDLKSTNGTAINSQIVSPGARFEVGEGDIITIGKTGICLLGFPGIDLVERSDLESRRAEPDLFKKSERSKDRRSRSSKELILINRVSKLLKQSFSMHGFLEKVLEYLLDSLPRIDTASIILMDYQAVNKEKKRKVVTRSREGLEPREGIISRRVVDQALSEGTHVRISSSVYDTDIDLSESKGTIQVGSVLCVPMISNSVIWGAVYVDSIQTQKGFRDEDVLLLNSLSGFLAVAMEKAMLSKKLKRTPTR